MQIRQIFIEKNLPHSSTTRLDLELLLMEVLHCQRAFLYANPEYVLNYEAEEQFNSFYARRLQGEPIAYILGKKEFWSLEFTVIPAVLIPRPETELLVELILEKITNQRANIADLGTGSGAIAISLAKERPLWNVTATDISPDVLQVASYNAMRLDVCNISFSSGAWCEALADRKFDAIVSNPPYIARHDSHLQHEELCFEPKLALVAGDDGLEALREIITTAKNHLNHNGWLMLEHGYGQKEAVESLLKQANYREIISYNDLSGIARVIAAKI
jgi:release factor glutamine methyltransferase